MKELLMRSMSRPRLTVSGSLALVLAVSLPLAAQNAGGGLDPGVPPEDCTARCDAVIQMLLAPCIRADGTIDQECADAALEGFDHGQCIQDCKAQNGGVDPEVMFCQSRCSDAYANGLQECTAPDGTVDPACLEAKDITFLECFVGCGRLPWLPDFATCVPPCIDAYRGAAAACAGENAVGFDCFGERRNALNDCLSPCGLAILPLENVCILRCETAFREALEACGGGMGDPNGGGGLGPIGVPGDDECFAAAQEAYNACLVDCGVTIPDPVRCAQECDGNLQVSLAKCAGDPACESSALAEYTMCLQGCGLVVPPIPEPDPCVSQCDRTYRESVGACYEPETGVVDGECLRDVDLAYLACLEGCGVVLPQPPDDPNSQCTILCDAAYRQALDGCFTVQADGMVVDVDQECVARADAGYLSCLEGCGVQPGPLPGDPGFPVGECEQDCGVAILGVLFACAAEGGGVVDEECLTRAGEAFNACLAGCKEQAEERVLAALARTGDERSFIRGDMDLSGVLQITDAIQVLSYLFLGGVAPVCEDAADADDDGRLNITDGIVILGHLFLGSGPLREPFGTPGTDPTPDALGCAAH
jgi:hypothetical protein